MDPQPHLLDGTARQMDTLFILIWIRSSTQSSKKNLSADALTRLPTDKTDIRLFEDDARDS